MKAGIDRVQVGGDRVATIKGIAERFGVSAASVSSIPNGFPAVGPDLRGRVLQVESVTAQQGCGVHLSKTDWNLYREKESLGVLCSRKVDSIIFIPSQAELYLNRLSRSSVPVASLIHADLDCDTVETDHVRGGYRVADRKQQPASATFDGLEPCLVVHVSLTLRRQQLA
jgi:DNA-binding LacI/PurR family transcriptional regulator